MSATFPDTVKSLNLIYPVSEIAEKTGWSKSNVSLFLNNKKEPTKAFLKKFNEVFNVKAEKEEVINIQKELPEILGEHEERLIRLESYVEVFEQELVALGSKGTTIITLHDRVRLVAKRRLSELK